MCLRHSKWTTYADSITTGEIRSRLTSRDQATEKLWRRHHLSYDQTRYVAKEVRRALEHKRSQVRMCVIERLSRDEERRLIEMAYRLTGARRLLIKTLFQTGARISEFVAIEVGDFFPRGICSRPTVIRHFRLGVSSNSSTRPFAGPVPFVHGEDGQGNVFLPPPETKAVRLFEVKRWPIRVETEGLGRGKTWPAIPSSSEMGHQMPAPWRERPLVNVCVGVDGARVVVLELLRLT